MLLFLHGQNTFLLLEKLYQIENQYRKVNGSALNLEKINASSVDFKQFWDKFKQPSMFIKKKLFFLENVFANDFFKKELIKKIRELSLSSDVVVVIEKDKIKKSDRLTKLLKENSQEQEFLPLEKRALASWLKKEALKYQAVIDNQALDHLIEVSNSDLFFLSNKIKQLVSYTKDIKSSDLAIFLKETAQAEVFKTIEAIASGDKKTALKLLQNHLAKGDSPFYLLSMVAYQFRSLLLVKSAEGDYRKLQALKMHPYVVKKISQLTGRFSMEKLKEIFKQILQTDLAMKTGQLNPEEALQAFLVAI